MATSATTSAPRLALPNTTPKPIQPAKNPAYIRFLTYRSNPTTTNFCGGSIGAGVPRPVRPKSQTHLSATAKPRTDGTAPIHRHRAAPTAATSNPSQEGNNQNHSAKNRAPTPNEATVVSQCAVIFHHRPVGHDLFPLAKVWTDSESSATQSSTHSANRLCCLRSLSSSRPRRPRGVELLID